MTATALKTAIEKCDRWTDRNGDARREIPEPLEDRILKAGYCPGCAGFGETVKLRRERADHARGLLAAKVCPNCEEAYDVEPGPYYETGDYGPSDADPGL